MAFDAFLTTEQAVYMLRRIDVDKLRQQQDAYRAELAQCCAADDVQGIQHAGGRLALATHILAQRTAGPALTVTPIGDAPTVEDDRGVVVDRGYRREETAADAVGRGIEAGRRAAEIQLEDERRGD